MFHKVLQLKLQLKWFQDSQKKAALILKHKVLDSFKNFPNLSQNQLPQQYYLSRKEPEFSLNEL